MSALSNLATADNVLSEGCDELVHHLLTVAGSLPKVSANHFAVFFFSISTTLSLFNSDMICNLLVLIRKDILFALKNEGFIDFLTNRW